MSAPARATGDDVSDSIQRCNILGTAVAQVSYRDVLELFSQWLVPSQAPRTVVAANVHVVTEAALHPSYAAAIADADLIVPDGMPLVWASRLLGGNISDRCYGPTLMAKTLDQFQGSETTHYFYGSTPEVLENLQKRVEIQWPKATVVGTCSPPFGAFDDAVEHSNIEQINASGAAFVWLGMGCPKQEQWMLRYSKRLNCRVVVAVGAAFDFHAGTLRQAPGVIQRMGMEWAYRLLMEPRRLWRRYCFRNPYFILTFIAQLIRQRLGGHET